MSLSTDNTVRIACATYFRATNAAVLLMSTVLIYAGVWEAMHGGRCKQWEAEPTIVFGVFLMGLSLLGIVGVRKKPYLLSIYLFMMLVLIILVMIITIFGFVITRKGAGKEYKLGDYSPWLQKRISNWNNVKNCLQSNGFCSNYEGDYSLQDYQDYNVALIQLGCCKPPSECDFMYQSPMVWNKPMTTSGNYSNNPDCGAWDNDPKVLCFNCDSCKAGLLEDMKMNWRELSGLNVLFLIVLIMWYAIGNCTFRVIWRDSLTLPSNNWRNSGEILTYS